MARERTLNSFKCVCCAAPWLRAAPVVTAMVTAIWSRLWSRNLHKTCKLYKYLHLWLWSRPVQYKGHAYRRRRIMAPTTGMAIESKYIRYPYYTPTSHVCQLTNRAKSARTSGRRPVSPENRTNTGRGNHNAFGIDKALNRPSCHSNTDTTFCADTFLNGYNYTRGLLRIRHSRP